MFHSAIRYVVAVIAGSIVWGCTCHPTPQSSLNVHLSPQETSMWCWASSGQMIMDYFGHGISQCQQANVKFGTTACPCQQCGTNPDPNPVCVQGGWPQLEQFGFTYSRTYDQALSWDDVQEQLSEGHYCDKKPFAFSWHWPGGSGHMMVAIGYKTVAGVNLVEVLDPFETCEGDARFIPYEEYVEKPGRYWHWDDFYDIEYEGGT